MTICLAVSIEYRRVTDRQTDGRDGHLATAVRAMHIIVLKNGHKSKPD